MTQKRLNSSATGAVKWCVMTAAIFWTVVYKLSESGVKVPDFVYVNF
jgi:hypothetical protein